MFDKLRDFLQKDSEDVSLEIDKTGTPTDKDLILATAVLLVEMAASDNEIAQEEGATVGALITGQFGVKYTELEGVIQAAIEARKKAAKIDQFVGCINEHFTEAQKQKVLAMLWKIVIADGKIDKFEERLTTQMKFRFQLTDEQAEAARRMAEEGEL